MFIHVMIKIYGRKEKTMAEKRIADLFGIRFGNLTAIEPTEKREAGYTVWRCICDCGSECHVDTKRLKRGTITNCGCIPKKHTSALLDLTGERYGSLTVLKRAENQQNGTAWLCKCDCGNEVIVYTKALRRGSTKSCGCRSHSTPYYRDLTGQRFGWLTVIKKTESRDYKGSILWQCHCDCGNDVLYSEDMLVHSTIVSCGCYKENVICKRLNETLHRINGTCLERLNLQKARSDSKSGHVGVHKINEGRYRAHISLQGKRYHLGYYTTLEEAIEARHRGEQLHKDFLNRYFQGYVNGEQSWEK